MTERAMSVFAPYQHDAEVHLTEFWNGPPDHSDSKLSCVVSTVVPPGVIAVQRCQTWQSKGACPIRERKMKTNLPDIRSQPAENPSPRKPRAHHTKAHFRFSESHLGRPGYSASQPVSGRPKGTLVESTFRQTRLYARSVLYSRDNC